MVNDFILVRRGEKNKPHSLDSAQISGLFGVSSGDSAAFLDPSSTTVTSPVRVSPVCAPSALRRRRGLRPSSRASWIPGLDKSEESSSGLLLFFTQAILKSRRVLSGGAMPKIGSSSAFFARTRRASLIWANPGHGFRFSRQQQLKENRKNLVSTSHRREQKPEMCSSAPYLS